jgi:DNA-binding MarR family transcriptional regulator
MPLNKSLGYMLGQAMRVYKIQVLAELKSQELELTFEQHVILHMLNSGSDLIQQDIANQLQRDKSIIVRQVNGLLDKQYVVQLTNKQDKRKKNLILTKKGYDILTLTREISDRVSEKLLVGIDDHELQTFQNVLTKIRENGG